MADRETGDRAQIGGVLADRLARHQASVVAADQPCGDDRQRDIGEAAADQQQFSLKRARRIQRRQAKHEHHRHQQLRAQRQRPAAVAGDRAGGEGGQPMTATSAVGEGLARRVSAVETIASRSRSTACEVWRATARESR